jgi:phosphatidylglycerophosphatase A
MNIKLKQSSTKLSKIILSWFGIGFFPYAPGTMGTIGSLFLIVPFYQLSIIYQILLIALSTILAINLTHKIQVDHQLHDPSWIVIDEVLGMLTTCLFLPNTNLVNIAIAFILFRFFDIVKFWPASYFDHMEHGAGTILDDIVSGVYAGLTLCILNYFLLLK